MVCIVNECGTITMGKYEDEQLDDIIRRDPRYIKWLREQDWAQADKDFMEATDDIKLPPMMLWFGKYKGMNLRSIANIDPGYIQYMKHGMVIRNAELRKELSKY